MAELSNNFCQYIYREGDEEGTMCGNDIVEGTNYCRKHLCDKEIRRQLNLPMDSDIFCTNMIEYWHRQWKRCGKLIKGNDSKFCITCDLEPTKCTMESIEEILDKDVEVKGLCRRTFLTKGGYKCKACCNPAMIRNVNTKLCADCHKEARMDGQMGLYRESESESIFGYCHDRIKVDGIDRQCGRETNGDYLCGRCKDKYKL